MNDVLSSVGGSRIQHGPDSNRIYLMKMDPADLPDLPGRLESLARERGYTKIFAKIPEPFAGDFLGAGFRQEARIPGFYRGETAAVFLGSYLDPERATDPRQAETDAIRSLACGRGGTTPPGPLPRGLRLREAAEADTPALASLYREVFATYPFPIRDPAYLVETLRSHIRYFIVEKDGAIIAAASGEMDRENRNAEMTDFATRPAYRGQGLASRLLAFMEPAMTRQGIITLYTIARAVSPGMNMVFAKAGYRLGGTLVNNTQIAGSIESMNLWYRTPPGC